MDMTEAIAQHLQATWPRNLIDRHCVSDTPLAPTVPNLQIFEIAPLRPANRRWVYVTCGAWQVPDNPFRFEFLLVSPVEAQEHFALLTRVVQYHADPQHPVRMGCVISIGYRWLAGSCEHLLVTSPYPYGENLEYLALDEILVRFCWLLPITKQEFDYMNMYGCEKLEERFDEKEINFLDPHRSSVV